MTRDEAMRAAVGAQQHTTPSLAMAVVACATAGADAELARVVAFMRQQARWYGRIAEDAIDQLAEELEARAHWKVEQ